MAKRIGDIPAYDRPREKLLRNGAAVLSDQELLAVLLGKGTSGVDVMTLAAKLAKVIDAKGLAVRADDLRGFDGVGDAKATLILAALEFARRRIKPEGVKVHTPADLLPHVRHYADRKQEHFLCASINGANEILNIRRLLSFRSSFPRLRESSHSLKRMDTRLRGCDGKRSVSESPVSDAKTLGQQPLPLPGFADDPLPPGELPHRKRQ